MAAARPSLVCFAASQGREDIAAPVFLVCGSCRTFSAYKWTRMLWVESANKTALRVVREVEKAGRHSRGLIRKSRHLSRAVQLEVLEEFVRRDQWELALPMYDTVREAAWYKWDASLHARMVALLAKADRSSTAASLLLETQQTLSLAQRAELGCALIDSYARQGLQDRAVEAFHSLRSLPLARALPLGFKALVRAYAALHLPHQAESSLREMKEAGYWPSEDEYKALLYAFGRAGELTKMETIACACRDHGIALDVAGFNMIITAYGLAGQPKCMVDTLERMVAEGVQPSMVSWNALSKACPTLITLVSGGRGLVPSPNRLLSRLKEHMASTQEMGIVQALVDLGVPSKVVTYCPATWQLDLHSMSMGTASVIFSLWLCDLRGQLIGDRDPPLTVQVITGRGKHSELDVKAPLRNMMLTGLADLKSPFRVDPQNRGALVARGWAMKHWVLAFP